MEAVVMIHIKCRIDILDQKAIKHNGKHNPAGWRFVSRGRRQNQNQPR